MNASSLARIERELGIILPQFYVDTMLSYPFPVDPSIEILSLTYDERVILNYNKHLEPGSDKYFIGSDGGEFVYFINLNSDETVYIYDYEGSEFHMSVLATSWEAFLSGQWETEQELAHEQKPQARKWWQFWR